MSAAREAGGSSSSSSSAESDAKIRAEQEEEAEYYRKNPDQKLVDDIIFRIAFIFNHERVLRPPGDRTPVNPDETETTTMEIITSLLLVGTAYLLSMHDLTANDRRSGFLDAYFGGYCLDNTGETPQVRHPRAARDYFHRTVYRTNFGEENYLKAARENRKRYGHKSQTRVIDWLYAWWFTQVRYRLRYQAPDSDVLYKYYEHLSMFFFAIFENSCELLVRRDDYVAYFSDFGYFQARDAIDATHLIFSGLPRHITFEESYTVQEEKGVKVIPARTQHMKDFLSEPPRYKPVKAEEAMKIIGQLFHPIYAAAQVLNQIVRDYTDVRNRRTIAMNRYRELSEPLQTMIDTSDARIQERIDWINTALAGHEDARRRVMDFINDNVTRRSFVSGYRNAVHGITPTLENTPVLQQCITTVYDRIDYASKISLDHLENLLRLMVIHDHLPGVAHDDSPMVFGISRRISEIGVWCKLSNGLLLKKIAGRNVDTTEWNVRMRQFMHTVYYVPETDKISISVLFLNRRSETGVLRGADHLLRAFRNLCILAVYINTNPSGLYEIRRYVTTYPYSLRLFTALLGDIIAAMESVADVRWNIFTSVFYLLQSFMHKRELDPRPLTVIRQAGPEPEP